MDNLKKQIPTLIVQKDEAWNKYSATLVKQSQVKQTKWQKFKQFWIDICEAKNSK